MITTSNFARSGKNPNAVAISIGVPKWWYGKKFHRLAPYYNTLHASKEEFDKSYHDKLANMDAKQVYDEIVREFGEDAVLLCWEDPNIRCHRRIVAEWFETELGITVPELGFGRSEIKPYAEMLDKGEEHFEAQKKEPALFDDLF